MYKRVQEPGVVARFTKGGWGRGAWGQTHFSPWFEEGAQIIRVGGVYLGN